MVIGLKRFDRQLELVYSSTTADREQMHSEEKNVRHNYSNNWQLALEVLFVCSLLLPYLVGACFKANGVSGSFLVGSMVKGSYFQMILGTPGLRNGTPAE